MNLFKSYCCLFYGSRLWKFNYPKFDKICKSWNIAIRTLLKLPYNTHTSGLSPQIGQLHLGQQLLYYKFSIKTCIYNARFTSNTLICYRLSFYRNMFHLDTRSHLHMASARLSVNTLNQASLGIISNIITLLTYTNRARRKREWRRRNWVRP